MRLIEKHEANRYRKITKVTVSKTGYFIIPANLTSLEVKSMFDMYSSEPQDEDDRGPFLLIKFSEEGSRKVTKSVTDTDKLRQLVYLGKMIEGGKRYDFEVNGTELKLFKGCK